MEKIFIQKRLNFYYQKYLKLKNVWYMGKKIQKIKTIKN